jgi:flagellin-like protein
MNYKKLRKNVKAVSPVISVLLMIAVAVAASLVTYAWVMGYMGFTTNKVGKAIQIQSIDTAGKVYVQNVGDSAVTLADVYFNGTWMASGSGDILQVGGTEIMPTSHTLFSGDIVTVKVTATDGTFSEITKVFQ